MLTSELFVLQKSVQRYYKLQDPDELANEKRLGKKEERWKDLCVKKRCNRGAQTKEDFDQLVKKEEKEGQSAKKQIRSGVKIPRVAFDPLWGLTSLFLPHPPSPPPAAATTRPAWWCASQPTIHPPSPPSPSTTINQRPHHQQPTPPSTPRHHKGRNREGPERCSTSDAEAAVSGPPRDLSLQPARPSRQATAGVWTPARPSPLPSSLLCFPYSIPTLLLLLLLLLPCCCYFSSPALLAAVHLTCCCSRLNSLAIVPCASAESAAPLLQPATCDLSLSLSL